MARQKKRRWSKRKRRWSKRKTKRGRKGKGKLFSSKFRRATLKLNRMSAEKRRVAALTASNSFIRDVSNAMAKLRTRPHLVKGSHKKILKRHRKKLQALVNPKVSIVRKRLILNQKGGIISALIPIIVAAIGATGTAAAGIGGAAVHAAISKS